MKRIQLFIVATILSFQVFSQKVVVVDGDNLTIYQLENGQYALSQIERRAQNEDAIWMSYDRRPGIDPWIREATNKRTRYTDEVFMQYFQDKGINIYGSLTTYQDCNGCSKCRAMNCPDLYSINFKISKQDWAKMKILYRHFMNATEL